MKKLFSLLAIFALIVGFCLEASAYTRYTYDRYGNKTGSVKSIYPGITSRYDSNGKKIGTYVTNQNGLTRGYDRYGRQIGTYATNRNGVTRAYDRYGRRYGTYYNTPSSYNRYSRPAYGYYR